MEPMRILIVDDEPVVVQVLSRQLRGKGYMVRSIGNAEDAILMAREERFDLILLDIALPRMSGLAAINVLRDTNDAIILVMTGHPDEEIRKDALLLGAAELIRKPFEYQQLMSVIRGISSRVSRIPCANRQDPSERSVGSNEPATD